MGEIIAKTFEEEYVSIFQGSREMTAALLREKFDYIFIQQLFWQKDDRRGLELNFKTIRYK